MTLDMVVVMPGRRSKMNRRKSKRSFTKGATRVHRKNGGGRARPMRGGIRL